jgi:hypothetical protein
MKWRLLAVAAVGIVSIQPVLAQHKVNRRCVDRPYEFSLFGLLTNPRPEPNGCAPPVYTFGKYIGQDPDPNIRFQLNRDPTNGYSYDQVR